LHRKEGNSVSNSVFIGFGSNLGDRVDLCDRAVTLMSLLPNSRLLAVSSLYETEPVDDAGAPGDGWFLNGVVQIETALTPQSLHTVCWEVEKSLGRDPEHRIGPRTMDLDLLFYRNLAIQEAGLTIPHPRLHLRRFVLEPLVELEPDLLHPVLKQTVSALLARLDDPHRVRKLAPQPNTRYGSRPACSIKS
jgi:2-amino-4-hydroxy-6-hydroxymethyldihydropteridine diphosphokinase